MGIVLALWRTAAHKLVVEVLLNRKLQCKLDSASTDMRVSYQTLVLLFLAGLCSLESYPVHTFFSRPIPGTLQNVSKNDTGVKEAVLTGTDSFNNKSNDAFLFRASAVDEAKRQIVKGIRYILEVEISRTVCRKRSNTDLDNCPFQTDRLLQQTFFCHFDVWSIPWMKKMSTTDFECRSNEIF
ncbi:cystatin-F [Carassius auratus]|uniref:Cystatin-F n=1 Tax=Carassius auratus TaxID=7957 RepID=A0A6P6L733_CARAU|nr:cystatin-F-like [Carassius auratus]